MAELLTGRTLFPGTDRILQPSIHMQLNSGAFDLCLFELAGLYVYKYEYFLVLSLSLGYCAVGMLQYRSECLHILF